MSKEQLIDLDKKQFDLLKKIIKCHIPDKTVWAYGSRVTWKADERSDLDLAVFDCNSMETGALRETLEESNLLISVDVMKWENIPEKFKENIKEKYVVLQEKPELEGWREVKLGEAVTFHYGKSLPEKDRIVGNFAVYSSAGLIDWHNQALINERGIIIGRKGNVGSVYKSEIPFYPIDTSFFITQKDTNCNLDYLFYMLSNLGLNSLNSDSAVPGLNRNTAYAQDIILPPLPEQKAIAEVLSSLDDKIDLLHRQNKTLEDMAQTLFRQWFVEEADEGWEGGIKKVASFANHKKINIKPCNNPEKYYSHYSISAFDNSRKPNIELGKDIMSNKYKVFDRSILVSKLNPRIPRIWAILEKVGNNAICSTEFQVVEPKEQNFFGFLYCFLKSKTAINKLISAVGGTSGSHQRVKPEDIFDLLFHTPSPETLDRFSNITEDLWDKISNNQSQIHILEDLRDTLLPKLMGGKILSKNNHG